MSQVTIAKPSALGAGRLRRFVRVPERKLLLPICAILAGLLVAALGVFHRAPPSLTAVPPGYVALVNQKGILMSDFISQVGAAEGMAFAEVTPARRSRVLRDMINEELLVQRALVLDLPETTTEVRDAMSMGVTAQVIAPLSAYPPKEAELRAFYDLHRANYMERGPITVRDLVLHVGGYANADQSVAQARVDAAEAAYQLRAGASLDYVMEHFGLVNSGRMAGGEEPDFAARLHLGDSLYEVASTLSDGEISDPVVEPDGVHILVVERHKPSVVKEFATVRDRVFDDFRTAEANRATEENLKLLRNQAQILIAPGHSE